MADLALVTANSVHIVETIKQHTVPIAEAVVAGYAVRQDTASGKWTKANATTAAEARALAIAVKTGQANEAVTGLQVGILDGYDLSGCSYDDPIYLSDTDGKLSTTPGTVTVPVGRVIAGTSSLFGSGYDKLLEVNMFGVEAAVAKDAGRVVVTSELLAASVDKWVFIADKAYKVTAVNEIHSVVGGSSAAVRPRKITDTSAPGASAGANVKELTTAAADLTATINTTQALTLSATAADLTLAAGDKIGLDFSGTLTGLVGLIEIVLKAV
ncbi:MAG: hypothetical protein J0I20_35755 [Chloroflexi bacterium]|nr:hypothetical protein [Chloroflexota bacterium]OJV86960.1 MAG: hypothetical protein BGO39_28570 [Chloroflexi bacterium 54-19]